MILLFKTQDLKASQCSLFNLHIDETKLSDSCGGIHVKQLIEFAHLKEYSTLKSEKKLEGYLQLMK